MKRIFKFSAIIAIICIAALIFSACGAKDGVDGESAYDIAVKNGFNGTETEWLASLQGKDGKDGADGADGEDATVVNSLYDEAVENGYTGTFFEFLAEYVKGDKGSPGDTDVTVAANKAVLSAVSVYCTFTIENGILQTTSSSAGSGVIINGNKTEGDAYIITNYHVVYNNESTTGISEDIFVLLYGMEYEDFKIDASYIGGSMTYDIALLKISDSEIYKNSAAQAATIADSDELVVGSTAIAIGNPEADGLSVTAGIVSVDSEYITMTSANNKTTVDYRVIRIDTAVNSGNSGGGLFNLAGELIGIVNAKIIDTSVENIGYAIPSNIAYGCYINLLKCEGTDNNTIEKCQIGITVKIASSKAVYDETNSVTRIVNEISVLNVDQSGSGYGIFENDDIIEAIRINDGDYIEINRMFTLIDKILTCKKGDIITFKVLRDGTPKTLSVTLTNSIQVE